jgi:hypothetical protein
MKKDNLLDALINFIVPITILYGIYFLVDFLRNGFFSLIYFFIIIASSFMVFSIKDNKIKNFLINYYQLITYFFTIVAIFFILMILFSITDLFSI